MWRHLGIESILADPAHEAAVPIVNQKILSKLWREWQKYTKNIPKSKAMSLISPVRSAHSTPSSGTPRGSNSRGMSRADHGLGLLFTDPFNKLNTAATGSPRPYSSPIEVQGGSVRKANSPVQSSPFGIGHGRASEHNLDSIMRR